MKFKRLYAISKKADDLFTKISINIKSNRNFFVDCFLGGGTLTTELLKGDKYYEKSSTYSKIIGFGRRWHGSKSESKIYKRRKNAKFKKAD
ncbi:hypothetical protein CBE01nite_14310 [Clostridium beijerinckii]|nr:hypothetical protein CBE01nite_14310 [Clostridium beijerinckii]